MFLLWNYLQYKRMISRFGDIQKKLWIHTQLLTNLEQPSRLNSEEFLIQFKYEEEQ